MKIHYFATLLNFWKLC